MVTLQTLIAYRRQSLGIREIHPELLNHPRNDPGVFHEAPAILKSYLTRAEHALAILDHRGSGQESESAREVETNLRTRLSNSGWGDRAEALVIDPELEVRIWSGSRHVADALGWGDDGSELRSFLEERGFWLPGETKPKDPAEAFAAALRQRKRARSSSILGRLARNVGLDHCRDLAFQRLKSILRRWFPPNQGIRDSQQ